VSAHELVRGLWLEAARAELAGRKEDAARLAAEAAEAQRSPQGSLDLEPQRA
jgi:hypothetical protein